MDEEDRRSDSEVSKDEKIMTPPAAPRRPTFMISDILSRKEPIKRPGPYSFTDNRMIIGGDDDDESDCSGK